VQKGVRPHEESNKGANEGANEAIHEESNRGAIEGANEITDVMLQQSAFSLGRVSVDGIIFCPHLCSLFPRGNIHEGKYITQERAATLKTFIFQSTIVEDEEDNLSCHIRCSTM
jgi:hypothetical protein